MAIAAGSSHRPSVSVESVSSAVHLVEAVLAGSFIDKIPARLIGEKAWDLDPLDQKVSTKHDSEMNAPKRHHRADVLPLAQRIRRAVPRTRFCRGERQLRELQLQLRDEFLNGETFYSLKEAQVLA